MKKYVIEFIGTFFLVLTCALTGDSMSVACMLIALIYMGYGISGAHYNPATTLSIWLLRKISNRDALIYVLLQMLAAVAASLCFKFLWGDLRRFVPSPNLDINPLKPLFVETASTFIMMMVILTVAASRKTAGNSYYGLAIGFVVLALAYGSREISGAAFNPAVGVGPLIADALRGGNNLGHAWLYVVGPLGGSALATFLFGWLDKE